MTDEGHELERTDHEALRTHQQRWSEDLARRLAAAYHLQGRLPVVPLNQSELDEVWETVAAFREGDPTAADRLWLLLGLPGNGQDPARLEAAARINPDVAHLGASRRSRPSRLSSSLERVTRGGTLFAALLAGHKRIHLRTEWTALLYGEDGSGLSRSRRFVYVAGFVWAALRMRAYDLGGPLWRPVDWILTKADRTNSLITASVGALAIYVVATDGVHALLTDGLEPCALLGGGLFALCRWLRRVRGIELYAARNDCGHDS